MNWHIVSPNRETDSGRDFVTNDEASNDPDFPTPGADWFHVDRTGALRLVELLSEKKATD